MTIDEMKQRKENLGLSCRQIADLSGVPLGTVQKIFGGATTSPRYETRQALEKVLASPVYTAPAGNASSASAGTGSLYLSEAAADYNAGSTAIRADGKKIYTLADWEVLPEDRHVELIEGELVDMAPPTTVHQLLIVALMTRFYSYVQQHHGRCRVIPAPFGVRLFVDDKTMLQPDINVICHSERLSRKWLNGAPDLVVEVLSPSNSRLDLTKKLQLYEEGGVRSYWIVDPGRERILVYDFTDADVLEIYTFADQVPVSIWDNKCIIDFAEIRKEIALPESNSGSGETD